MALALSQQAYACLEWTPVEKLITFNMTCLCTFHTNSFLHSYLFLMHVHECLCDKKLVLFTWIQCFMMNARIFNDHKS